VAHLKFKGRRMNQLSCWFQTHAVDFLVWTYGKEEQTEMKREAFKQILVRIRASTGEHATAIGKKLLSTLCLSDLVNWMYHASVKEEKSRDPEKKKNDERAKKKRLRNAVQDYLV
jgi:hypothetical protein